ncbi:pseudouridine synthase [Nocardia sp. NPDC004068]|uniref:pseudouridine synthase n=1 Tax=Nocardia sp. NPDC004068 TaxID=3364303 RepID=UPI0036AADBA6
MNTPARRDGTPDRRKRRIDSPQGGSASGRGGDRGRGDRGGHGGSDRGSRGGRGGFEREERGGYGRDARGDRGGFDRADRGGTGRGGYGRDERGRGGFDRDARGGRGRFDRDDRANSGRGGFDRDERTSYGRGGFDRDERAGYGRGGAERGRGGFDRDDRGGFDRGRGGFERSGGGRAGQERGFGSARGGSAPDRAGGRGDGRSSGGGRPPTSKPAPSRKPQRQRREQTVLSFAKPARHQNVEPEETGPKKLPWGEGERLQKVLAKAGVASRRAAEELIEQGRVEVDGVVVREQGLRIDPNTAVVRVDGVRVVVRDEQVYLALNKPKGYQSTMSDELGRPCVGDIVAERVMAGQRLFHVGRLDAETEGLLLITNDGDLAHRLMHPSFEVSKTYLATVHGEVKREIGKRLRDGVELDDGPAKVDRFQVLDLGEGRSLVKLVLHEGRKHIVRRLLAAVGHPVIGLVRTNIGPVALGDQRPGSMRVLGRDEIGKLYEAVSL